MNSLYLCACLGMGVGAFGDFLRSMLGHLKVSPLLSRLLDYCYYPFPDSWAPGEITYKWGQRHPSLQARPGWAASSLETALPHPGN